MAAKNIAFNYFTISLIEKGKGEVLFDFEKWISLSDTLTPEELTRNINKVLVRRDTVNFSSKGSLYTIRFMRLRQDGLPFIVKEDAEAKDMTLAEDEYLGEDTNMLYDTRHKVIMLQKNRFSVPRKYLEDYLTSVWNSDKRNNGVIKLNVVVQNFSKEKMKNISLKKLDLRIANQLDETTFKSGDFFQILRALQKSNSTNSVLTLSAKKACGPLSQDVTSDAVEFAMDNLEYFSAARITPSDESSYVDEINLIENAYTTFISFKNVERTSIAFEYMSSKMKDCYTESTQNVVLSLLQKE